MELYFNLLKTTLLYQQAMLELIVNHNNNGRYYKIK